MNDRRLRDHPVGTINRLISAALGRVGCYVTSMTDHPIFVERTLQDAEELLTILLGRDPKDLVLWQRGDEENWIFRGQSESHWKLTPSAFRENAFLAYMPEYDDTTPSYSPDELRKIEEGFVKSFASHISHAGLEVPGDSQELRDADFTKECDARNFPPVNERGIYALAQHSGVPTRFLDWSYHPLVAAYFAAISPAKWLREKRPIDPKSTKHFAIWAVQRAFVNGDCRPMSPAGALVVSVAGSNNPNLKAQSGIFTLVRFQDELDTVPLNRLPPDLDDLIHDPAAIEAARGRYPTVPMMYKFNLPHTEAGWLLYRLQQLQIDASSLFPGHEGVARKMREQKYVQRSR